MKLPTSEDLPHLFRPVTDGPVQLTFEFRQTPPPFNLISNVNLIPFSGQRWVIIRLQSGEWEIPGGTLEPGEHYIEAIQRELSEEAGAHLITFETLGAWRCHSSASKPYRPHVPHPDFYRLVGYGQVELIGSPQNPAGGEQVALVEAVSLAEARQRFLSVNRPDLAELYQLVAAQLRD